MLSGVVPPVHPWSQARPRVAQRLVSSEQWHMPGSLPQLHLEIGLSVVWLLESPGPPLTRSAEQAKSKPPHASFRQTSSSL